MRKRVAVPMALFILALGTAVAAQAPSPEATPLYAPDDLAFTIPSDVGGLVLDVETVGLSEFDASAGDDPVAREYWRDLLLPLGKEPADVRWATGEAEPSGLSLQAMRVDGVLARDYVERYVDIALQADPAMAEVMLVEWQTIDDREVLSATISAELLLEMVTRRAAEEGVELTEEAVAAAVNFAPPHPDAGIHLYPKGEVLFGIFVPFTEDSAGVPSLAQILTELP